MKKIALFIIAAMLVLSFFGCNEKSEKVVENEKAPVEENTGEAVDTTEEEINPFVIVEQPIDYDTTSTMGREFWVFVEGGKKPYTYQWVTMTDDGEKELDDATDGVEGSKTYLLFTSPTNEGTTKFKCYITDANGEKLESRVASLKYTVGVNPAAPPVEEKEPEFELVSSDGQYEFNVYTTEETVTLKVKAEYDGTESVDYRWYRCDEKGNTLKEFNYGNPLSMSEKLEVTGIPYEEMMIPRYYLASATIGNTTKTSKFSITLCPMGVEVEEPDWAETDEEFLLVSEDGNYEYTVYSPDEEVVLKVIPLDTSGILSSLWDEEQKMYLVDYCWTRCDENGTTLESHPTPMSWGQSCTVSIPWEEMMTPRYYRANAMVGDISKYVIFKVMLAPMGIEVDE